MLRAPLQTAFRVLFPPTCVKCGTIVESEFGLCGPCWAEVPFISGPVCQMCGIPVLADASDQDAKCDACRRIARPWSGGRAALEYRDAGREFALGLKHSDRYDIARAAGSWLAQAARALITPQTIIVPVPLHPKRLLRRRYNQSALLAQAIAEKVNCRTGLDVLVRTVHTIALENVSAQERFARLQGSMTVHPKRRANVQDAHVLLVDDVMTSGATLAAATDACLQGGARRVDMVVLARVTKDD